MNMNYNFPLTVMSKKWMDELGSPLGEKPQYITDI